MTYYLGPAYVKAELRNGTEVLSREPDNIKRVDEGSLIQIIFDVNEEIKMAKVKMYIVGNKGEVYSEGECEPRYVDKGESLTVNFHLAQEIMV